MRIPGYLSCCAALLLVWCPGAIGARDAAPKTKPNVAHEAAPAGLYGFSNVPAWVNGASADYAAEAPLGEVSDGTWNLVYDRQIDVGDLGDQRYTHLAIKALDAKGVEAVSQFNLGVDPAYQKLMIHSLRVVRRGKEIDETKSARITVLPEETQLAEHIYDGAYNINVVLSDVQPGDVVEYEYTLSTAEHFFAGNYSTRMSAGWSAPVHWARISVRYPPGRNLRYRISGGSLSPRQADRDGRQVLSLILENPAPIHEDADAPDWYSQFPALEVSDFPDWPQIARGYDAMFRLSDRPRKLLDEAVAAIQAPGGTPEQLTMRALQMVQSSIRYTSISIGRGSLVPSDPETVLERRFGDCKDKAQLLVALLRRLGIDASVALVNTERGHELPKGLPTPYAFDHAITRVHIGGKTYWLDPTRYRQYGSLISLAPADFENALVIDPASTSLEAIPRPAADAGLREVHMDFELGKGIEQPAAIVVTSSYSGESANDMRETLAGKSLAQRQADYLNYYARLYPGIKAGEPMTVSDDTEQNFVQTVEHYTLDRPFPPNDKGRPTLHLATDEMDGFGEPLDASVRTSPLAIRYPHHVRQVITAHLPKEWPKSNDSVAVDDPAFRYRSTEENSKGLLTLVYDFQALSDHIEVDDMPRYLADRASLYADLGYNVWPPSSDTTSKLAQDKLADLRGRLQLAAKTIPNDMSAGCKLIDPVVVDADFESLSEKERRAALLMDGSCALTTKENARAHELLIRSSSLPSADFNDWSCRLDAAFRIHDYDDAVLALTKLAATWPEALSKVNDSAIYNLLGKARQQTPANDNYFKLLSALWGAHWKSSDGIEPGGAWRDLAEMLSEKGETDLAADVASHVAEPYVLISMRADKRFDAVIKRNPAHYDIDRAAASQVADLRERIKKSPRSLQALVELNSALMANRKYDEILSLTDEALKRITDADSDHSAYDDVKTKLIWVMDARARALLHLNRTDEALEQWVRASRHPEGDGVNVSQAINLGSVYCDLDRPKDALSIISEMGQLSPFGRMQLEGVRLAAALELNDVASAETALSYLRDNQADAPATYQEALMLAGRLDDASALLISRLQDPKLRSDALRDVQQYAEPPVPPRAQARRVAWHALVARPDVQAAIAMVGRVDRYVLASQ